MMIEKKVSYADVADRSELLVVVVNMGTQHIFTVVSALLERYPTGKAPALDQISTKPID
jgi:hypothetical protein